LYRRAVGRGADGLQHAPEGIGEEHVGPTVGGLANQHATQAIVVGVALVDARSVVEVLFEAEGVDGHAGGARAGRAAQHAATCCIVDILFLAVGACIILGQVVESVVGKRGAGAAHGAAGDVAPGIIAARVGLPGLGAARRAQAVEAGQLVWVAAVTVEVLRVGTAGALRSLPHLSQVGVEVAGVVACSGQAVGEGAAATGAIASARLGTAVACPHQAILLVVAVVMRIELIDHCLGYKAIIYIDTSLLNMFMI